MGDKYKQRMKFRVNIRYELAEIKSEAYQLNGNVYTFREGWVMCEEDTSLYVGEVAMIPQDSSYPEDAPHWIASGDLERQH